jgi:hypothetical protein
MRRRGAALLFAPIVVAVLICGRAAAQSSPDRSDTTVDATAAVQQCIDRIGSEPLGLPVMEVRCPGLSSALQTLHLRPLLIESSRAKLSRDSLRQLSILVHPASGPMPSLASLGPILRGLHPPPAVTRSWWQRLLDWMIEHLGRKSNGNLSIPWLGGVLKVLARLTWIWTVLFALTIIALPVGVGYLIVLEMRAMGRKSVDQPVGGALAITTGPTESRLALVRQLPLGERPAHLFALLITQLVAAGRLPPARSLTHREVARRAQVDDADQQRLIDALARLSERQLYAGVTTMPPGVDELLARAEDLYTTGWAAARSAE